MRITDLQKGNQIAGWMALGRALKKGRNFDGSAFRYVPLKVTTISKDDLQTFIGQVVENNTHLLTLTVNVSRMGSYIDLHDTETLQAEIAYPLLQRIRIFSDVNHEPKPKSPTSLVTHIPYRTIEEVLLKW